MSEGSAMQGPTIKRNPDKVSKPPREGVCPECWGWSFHRDMCSQNDGKPRPEALADA